MPGAPVHLFLFIHVYQNSASIASFIGEELETILVRITMEEGRQMGEQEEDGSVQEELEQSNPSTLTGPRIGQDLVSSLPSATSGLQMNTTQDLPLPSVPMPNMVRAKQKKIFFGGLSSEDKRNQTLLLACCYTK